LSPGKADEIKAQVVAEMRAAVDFGVKSPFPKLESALEYVYA
jgi:TPP-dependent pyruvate/acetoin dehydrogenase alpha subunit